MSGLLSHLRDPARLPALIWKTLRYPFTQTMDTLRHADLGTHQPLEP
jgi:hypothetical protein